MARLLVAALLSLAATAAHALEFKDTCYGRVKMIKSSEAIEPSTMNVPLLSQMTTEAITYCHGKMTEPHREKLTTLSEMCDDEFPAKGDGLDQIGLIKCKLNALEFINDLPGEGEKYESSEPVPVTKKPRRR